MIFLSYVLLFTVPSALNAIPAPEGGHKHNGGKGEGGYLREGGKHEGRGDGDGGVAFQSLVADDSGGISFPLESHFDI